MHKTAFKKRVDPVENIHEQRSNLGLMGSFAYQYTFVNKTANDLHQNSISTPYLHMFIASGVDSLMKV